MNLRTAFEWAIGNKPITDALAQMASRINLIWSREHSAETGAHGIVTADQLHALGPTVLDETAPANGVHIGLGFDSPRVVLANTTPNPDNIWEIDADTAASLRFFQPSVVSASLLGTDGSFRLARATAGYFERARTTAMGDWIDVAFNAANFTASAGAWTVILANQITYTYTLVGRTMTLAFWIDATNVTVGGVLFLAIPGGFTAARAVLTTIQAIDAGVAQIGLAFVTAGATVVDLRSNAGAGGWAFTAMNNTTVRGEITFPVQ